MKKIVLMYHDIFVKDAFESGFQNGIQYKVQENLFEAHVKAIAEYCKIHKEIEVEFTFDDGGVSFLTKAAPILEKYGYRGVFFISTKYIGTEAFLSIEQIKELSERGHRIGSHTHTHPENMQSLSVDEIKKEWEESVDILSPFTNGCVEASIPNGFSNKDVINLAHVVGIDKLYTSTPTTKVSKYKDTTLIGRYAIYRDYSIDDVLSIVYSRRVRLKKYVRTKILGVAKLVLGPLYTKIKIYILKRRYLND